MSEFTGAARAAVAGIREALDAAKEVDAVAKDIAKLGEAELQARSAYRRKQKKVSGDTTIFTAVDEWRRLHDIKQLEKDLEKEITEKHGKEAWQEIMVIKERHIKENKDILTEDGHDRRKMAALKWWCFISAFILVSIIYILKGP